MDGSTVTAPPVNRVNINRRRCDGLTDNSGDGGSGVICIGSLKSKRVCDYSYSSSSSVYLAVFIFVFLIFLSFPSGCAGCNDEEDDCHVAYALKLNYDLFEAHSYNPLIRPVLNTSDSLTINFTLALSTIINVDSKNQFLVTNVWLQMYWHDYQMTWDPVEYGDINTTRINKDRIWVPDIVLFNNADGNYEPSFIPNVVVDNNGDIKFIPPAIYTSSCSIDVEYFPFDQQVCEMKFGSWTFSGKTLRYQFQYGQKRMEMTDYMRNGAWNIISCDGHIETVTDVITGEPKELIVYELVIRRKTLFYTVNLIIPCFLHALVCLCVFVLPEQGKKISLVVNVLVSLVVFLVLVQKILPPSKKIPLIAKYFLFTFIMNVLEILATVLIIFASHKSPRTDTMPKWFCWLLLYKLPKYLFMERPDHDERWQPKRCDDPPSYPITPQISRAILSVAGQAFPRFNPSVSPVNVPHRGSGDVNSPRRYHRNLQGSDSLTQSSMGSEFHASSEDLSASGGTAEGLLKDFPECSLPPIHGHRCMLRDPGMSGSADTLEGRPRHRPPQPVGAHAECNTVHEERPLWTTKEICSAVNAIKFIWRQMQNKEEYETVTQVSIRVRQYGNDVEIPWYWDWMIWVKDDWKYIGAVLDRLLMVIFVLVTLGGTISCLANAPHILETLDEEKILETIRSGSD